MTRKQIGLDKVAFDRLDRNHDGQLDADELSRFSTGRPDVELVIQIGRIAAIEERADVRQGHGRAASLDCAVQPAANDTLLMTIGAAQISVQARPEPATDNLKIQAGFVRQFILQQFQAADVEKKGYVEQRKLKGEVQSRFLHNLFSLADRDGDGKLTERELIAFLDLQEHAPQSCAGLEITNAGRGLFEILDANRDGRLGQRELRTAWSRLAVWDRNGDGMISRRELPQQFQLTLGRGHPFRSRNNASADGGTASAPTKGPLWFRKMDRNGDGDVSPREFLGTPEEFRRIDTDHDGLIDPQEAEAAGKPDRHR